MSHLIFVTGGARSGKSRYAEERALQLGCNLGYLATAQVFDEEMRERVQTHQQRRGGNWTTAEEPYDISGTLRCMDGNYDAILIDCITIWLSNLLLQYEDDGNTGSDFLAAPVERLVATLQNMKTPVIMVSNEVGMGIVPESRLGRIFRDMAGLANQKLAGCADEVHAVISGIPLRLK